MGTQRSTSTNGFRPTVSRRGFVRAAGALSGFSVLGAQASLGAGQATTVVRWASNTDLWELTDTLQQALWESGLDDTISLEIIPGPGETNVVEQQYTRWLSGELNEPDLLMTDSGWTLDLIVRNQLLNLSDTLPKALVTRLESDYFQTSLDGEGTER